MTRVLKSSDLILDLGMDGFHDSNLGGGWFGGMESRKKDHPP